MKKIKFNIVDFLVYIELFTFVFGIVLSKGVTNLDELWHFNIARQMSKGLIPYKEISLITTPFFPFIASFFLKGPFDELIVYRIICSLFYAAIFFLAYKILKKTTKNIPMSIVFTNVLAFIMEEYMLFEYNAMCILLTLTIILIELELREEKNKSLKINSKVEKNINNINTENKKIENQDSKVNKKNQKLLMQNFGIGILAGFAFLTKQTIGAFIIFAVLFLKIIEIISFEIEKRKTNKNENNIKNSEKIKIHKKNNYLNNNNEHTNCNKNVINKKSKTIEIKNENGIIENNENKLQNYEGKNLLQKELLAKILGIIIPILIFVIYLACTKSFADFVSYCFLGISTFSNKKSYTILLDSTKTLIKVLSHLMPIILLVEGITICILFFVLKKKSNNLNNLNINKKLNKKATLNNIVETNKNLYENNKIIKNNNSKIIYWNNAIQNLAIIFYYSLFMLLIEYPIADYDHFVKANFILMLSAFIGFYYLVKFLIDKTKMKQVVKSTVASILLGIMVTLIVFDTETYYVEFSNESKKNELNHFKYLEVSDSITEERTQIENLINENSEYTVYILDSNAVVFDITLDRYFKNYDMFNNGNFGKDSSNGIINTIENSKNSIYLIRNEKLALNWQTPKDVIEYIRNNLTKTGDCGIYEVYLKQ